MFLPYFGGPEPLLLLLLALATDLAVGDIRLIHRLLSMPAALVRSVVRALDRRLNRIQRGDRTRRWRGIILVALIGLLALASGWLIAGLCRRMAGGWLIELVLVTGALDLRGLWSRVRRVGAALRERGLDAGRQALVGLSDQQIQSLDDHGVVRTGIEALAIGMARRVSAPVLWYGLFGLPGLLSWIAVDTMAAEIGHDTLHYAQFGWAAARTAAILSGPPAVLAAVLIAAGAVFTPGAMPALALRTALSRRGDDRTVAAMAGAVGVALGGPRREGDQVRRTTWIGDGRARALPSDLDRALSLFGITGILVAGLTALGLTIAAAAS
ncbi:MAG: cobalamin biosynthesis protein [Azospirillaceae bacterium]|nr:cobalamin biosynthesis protein [Azospirillaceae bacterium]